MYIVKLRHHVICIWSYNLFGHYAYIPSTDIAAGIECPFHNYITAGDPLNCITAGTTYKADAPHIRLMYHI